MDEIPAGAGEASLLAVILLLIKLMAGRMADLRERVSSLQRDREIDSKELISTLHEMTITLHKIGHQTEVQTKLTEKLIDRMDKEK